jgi:hypothetical protein
VTTVSATISGSPGLTLTSAPYFIWGGTGDGPSGMDPGQVINSRIWATSAFVAGAVQVWSVPGEVAATLKVYVYETTDQTDLRTDLTSLIDAFQQPSYTLAFDIGGATYSWSCANADYAIDAFPIIAVVGLCLGVTFDIPRSPIPVSGPI